MDLNDSQPVVHIDRMASQKLGKYLGPLIKILSVTTAQYQQQNEMLDDILTKSVTSDEFIKLMS